MSRSSSAAHWYDAIALSAVVVLLAAALTAALVAKPEFLWWLGLREGVYGTAGALFVFSAAILFTAAAWHARRPASRAAAGPSSAGPTTAAALTAAVSLWLVFGEEIRWGHDLLAFGQTAMTGGLGTWTLQSHDVLAGGLNVAIGLGALFYLGLLPWLTDHSQRLHDGIARWRLPLLSKPAAVFAMLLSLAFVFVSIRLFWLNGSLGIAQLASLAAWRTFLGSLLAAVCFMMALRSYLAASGELTWRARLPLVVTLGIAVPAVGLLLGLSLPWPPAGGGHDREQIIAHVTRIAETPPGTTGRRPPVLKRVGFFQRYVGQALVTWPELSPGERSLRVAEALIEQRRYAEAEEVVVKALDHSTSAPEPQSVPADFTERAKDVFARVHEGLGSSDLDHVRAATSLLSQGKHEIALAYLELAIAANPDNSVIRLKRGRVLTDLRRLREGLEETLAAAELDPGNPDVHVQLGEIWFRAGDLQKAHDGAEMALQLDPDSPGALMLRGMVRISINDFRGAVEDFTRLLELEPENQQAMIHRGVANLLMGFEDRAKTDFARCRELYPQSASEIAVRIGTVRWAQGRPAQAVRRFEEAVRLDPDNQTARQWLQRVEEVLFKSAAGDADSSG